MVYNLKEVLDGLDIQVPEENIHRSKPVTERPKEEVALLSIAEENMERVRNKLGCTEDLVWMPKGELTEEMRDQIQPGGYIVTCTDNQQSWYAPNEVCLNQNFIYRGDLEIHKVEDKETSVKYYLELCKKTDKNQARHYCYILDNPTNETYEVFFESNYPQLTYGKSTPQGCAMHRYENRFYRDLAILELDKLYSSSSFKNAGELIERELGKDEAIIISDGAWMKNVCSCSYVYMTNEVTMKNTSAFNPSDENQAVLIAEISGAHAALEECYRNKKTNISYYYDNTSIVNVFRNKKMEYLDEIKQYKAFLEKMYREHYTIKFIELHPKTGEDRSSENKALMFFHNMCDKECREISDIAKKKYKTYTVGLDKEGKTFGDLKKEFKPKQNNNRRRY